MPFTNTIAACGSALKTFYNLSCVLADDPPGKKTYTLLIIISQPMNLEELRDSTIVLIVCNAEKKDDMHVYLGKLQVENGKHYFVNEEKGWTVSLDEEQLNQLRPVSDDLREMLLNADYALFMNMGDLPHSN